MCDPNRTDQGELRSEFESEFESDYGNVTFDSVTFGNSVSVMTDLSQLKQPNLILVHLDFKIQSKHPPTQDEISAENVKMKVLLSFTNLFKSHIVIYIYKHLIIFKIVEIF